MDENDKNKTDHKRSNVVKKSNVLIQSFQELEGIEQTKILRLKLGCKPISNPKFLKGTLFCTLNFFYHFAICKLNKHIHLFLIHSWTCIFSSRSIIKHSNQGI